MSAVEGWSERFWLQFPAAVRRRWLALGMILSDGSYLRAWPVWAVTVPLGAAVLAAVLAGLLAGISGGPLYTYSFPVVALLVLVSGLGAGVGIWAFLGFTLVNLVVADRSRLPGFYPFQDGHLDVLLHGWVPLAIAYGLLFVLLVMGPFLSQLFGTATERAVRGRSARLSGSAGALVAVLVFAGYAYSWAQAVPFMIRPLWSFGGSTPEISAVQPIQSHTVGLFGVALLAGTLRAVLAGLSSAPAPAPVPVPAGRGSAITLAWVPFQALLIALLLGGLVGGPLAGVLLWLALCGIGYLRTLVVPALRPWAAAVRRVPLLVRVLACAGVSYALTAVVVQPAVDRGATSFVSLVLVVLASLLVAAFLLPGRQGSGAGR
jgi:hypothetical protein